MTVREQVVNALDSLTEAELRQVSEFLAFLRYRARRQVAESWNVSQAAALYAEFSEEDRQMAEEGMAEYAELLATEDTR